MVPIPSYRLHVAGRLEPATLASLEGLQASVEPAETVLSGTLDDHQLRQLLGTLQDLGLELTALRQLAATRWRRRTSRRTARTSSGCTAAWTSARAVILAPEQVRAQGDDLVLLCQAQDQAQLQGLIECVRSCGLELLEVRPYLG